MCKVTSMGDALQLRYLQGHIAVVDHLIRDGGRSDADFNYLTMHEGQQVGEIPCFVLHQLLAMFRRLSKGQKRAERCCRDSRLLPPQQFPGSSRAGHVTRTAQPAFDPSASDKHL